ncbi:MAG: FHA domain-containing protein [Myxococcota bacterium]
MIGRSPSCDLQLDHPTVSAEHAVLFWEASSWQLRDLGSRNGTRVDGRPLEPGVPVRLEPDAVVQFGRHPGAWRVTSLDPPSARGLDATAGASLTIEQLTVQFEVSSDEEYVRWSVLQEGRLVELGDRVHTYLLLTLARRRLADADVPEPARGWCYADDLAHRLGITPEVMKVYVYRARRQLEEAGVARGGDLIERRAANNQIRMATDRITIRRG